MINIILILIDVILLFDYKYKNIYFSDVASVILLIIFIINSMLHHKKRINTKILYYLILFIIFIIFNLNISRYNSIIHISISILLFFILYLNIDIFKKYNHILESNFKILIYVFTFIIMAQFILLNIFHINFDLSFGLMDSSGQRNYNEKQAFLRSSGLYVEPAHQSLMLIFLLILAEYSHFKERYILFIVISLIFTFSTIGLIADIIYLLYYIFIKNKAKNKIKILCMIIILFIINYKSIIIYLFKIFQINNQYSSAYIRLVGPIVILQNMNFKELMIGIGFGNIQEFLIKNNYINSSNGATQIGSNSLLQFLTSGGIILLFIFILFKLHIFFNIKQGFNDKFSKIAFILYLIIDFGGDYSYLPWYWVILFIIRYNIENNYIKIREVE